jgi:Protein of unknown function (DUF3303)
MKFMVTWRLHAEKRQAALSAFAQMTAEDDKRDMGSKIKLIGRWHDFSRGTGVAICECEDGKALANWALHWTSFMDIETSPVLDDAEAREVGVNRTAEIALAN